jgi:uncharacterized protein YecT (DUF1311 family)
MADTTQTSCRRPLRLLPIAGLALAGIVGTAAQTASFDCTKAATSVEKLICADAELSRLDSRLAAAYREARRGTDDPQMLLAEQRAWLEQRNRCGDGDCLTEVYRQRIAALGGDAGGESTAFTMGEPSKVRTAKGVRISQEGPNFSIEAAYPRLGDGKAAAAERVLARLVEDEVDAFRAQYQEAFASDAGHQGPPWALGIDYEQVYTAPRFWSVGLSSYHYTGGAHGGVQHMPVVIDRQTGQRVPPARLFRSGGDWLEALAGYSYRTLSEREPFTDGDEWLREGTAPKRENYRKLLPLADGLHIVFEQYQVGPYAIGFHEVTVPYAELSGLLNPDLFPNGRP